MGVTYAKFYSLKRKATTAMLKRKHPSKPREGFEARWAVACMDRVAVKPQGINRGASTVSEGKGKAEAETGQASAANADVVIESEPCSPRQMESTPPLEDVEMVEEKAKWAGVKEEEMEIGLAQNALDEGADGASDGPKGPEPLEGVESEADEDQENPTANAQASGDTADHEERPGVAIATSVRDDWFNLELDVNFGKLLKRKRDDEPREADDGNEVVKTIVAVMLTGSDISNVIVSRGRGAKRFCEGLHYPTL